MANVPKNPRATYKAQLLNYDALLAMSDEECSYCLSEREIGILLPFIEYVAWKTRYQATETEIDVNLIERWSGNLARKLMTGCCGDEGLHRFTEDGVYESSLDGGVTWNPDPENDPRNDTTYFPPLDGEDGSAKRCEGAANAQEFFKQNLIDELASGLAYAEIYSTVVGIIAILGVTGIGVIIAVASAAIFVAGVIVVQAAFTSEVWEDFKCILYCNISDDASFTENQWNVVKNKILSDFTGVVQIILWNWVNALGYIGLTNSARSNMALGAECDCDCPASGCNTEWTATLGTILGEFGGYLRVQSVVDGGTSKITIQTPDEDTCCTLLDCRVIEPEGVSPFLFGVHINCGVPQTFENLEFSLGLGGCYNLVGTRLADTDTRDFVVEFLFDVCP